MLQIHDAGARRRDVRLRDDEGLAVTVVEPQGHVPGQLQVLALVVADGDRGGVIEEDVRRHQDRIREESDPRRLLPLPLVLELGHPPQLTHGGGAFEQPGQLGVLGNVALYEERATVRIEPDGEQVQRRIQRVGAEVGRVDLGGESVQIDHEIEGVVAILEGDPLPKSPEVVPQSEIA